MKISNASKKVLASALSAAMVVAFAPTVAFGADLGAGDVPAVDKGEAAVQVVYKDKAGKTQVQKFSANVVDEAYGAGIQGAFDFAAANGAATVQLLGDITADVTVKSAVTIDLNGYTWTNAGDFKAANGTIQNMPDAPITIDGAASVTKFNVNLIPATAVNAPAGTVVLAESTDQITDANAKIEASYATAAEATAAKNIASGQRYEVAGKIYDATTLASAPASYAGYYVLATSKTTSAAITGSLTIKDSSEAKTGKVSGNQVNVKEDGTTETVATAAVVTNGKSLSVKGGSFTTGSADINIGAADNVLKAIDGTVSGVENATIEAIGGTYKPTSGTHAGEVLGQTVEAVVTDGSAVKNSSIKAVAADFGSAVTLEANGNIEGTVVEAVAGASAVDGTHKDASSAIAIKSFGAPTYKRVTATATANGSSESSAKNASTAIAVDRQGVKATTINSGTYTGEMVKTAGASSITLKGGTFSKHLASTDAVIASDAKVVCTGEGGADYVFTELGDASYTAGSNAKDSDIQDAVTTAANNAVYDAVAGKAKYGAALAYAEGNDAAKLAEIAIDYDLNQNLKAELTMYNDLEAATVKAPKTLTAEQVAFNGVVTAADAAAKAADEVVYVYGYTAAKLTYKAPKASKAADFASITDLGKTEGATTGTNHGAASTALVDNSYGADWAVCDDYVVWDTTKGVVNTYTKSAAAVKMVSGDKLVDVAFNAKDKAWSTTALGGFAVTSENAESVKSQLEELIKQLGGKVEEGNNTIAALQAQLVKLQDQSSVAKIKGKTVKAKASKKTTAKLKAVKSDSGAKSTFKKVKGTKKVTVSKSGKITVAKGLKKGAKYTVKVKATVGAATKTVNVVVKVAK